jgi:hypothetical protein
VSQSHYNILFRNNYNQKAASSDHCQNQNHYQTPPRDTDDSTENSSESFYERRPVMAIMSYVGAEDSHSEMRAKYDTSGQKMGWQSLVRPSMPLSVTE